MTRVLFSAASAMAALVVSMGPSSARAATDPAVERGAHVAVRDCAYCHATGMEEKSPNPSAPTFRDIRLRYNPISLERRLHPMPARGHDAMPPGTLAPGDVSDLVVYIQSLTPPVR